MQVLTEPQKELIEVYLKEKGYNSFKYIITRTLKTSDPTMIDELLGEADMALVKAAKTYDAERASFSTHVSIVFTTWLKSWIRDNNRLCRKVNLVAASLDETDENGISNLDKVVGEFDINSMGDRAKAYWRTLNKKEQQVLTLRMEGYSWSEIKKHGYTSSQIKSISDGLKKYEKVKLLWS